VWLLLLLLLLSGHQGKDKKRVMKVGGIASFLVSGSSLPFAYIIWYLLSRESIALWVIYYYRGTSPFAIITQQLNL
jgi:hypothetical protein